MIQNMVNNILCASSTWKHLLTSFDATLRISETFLKTVFLSVAKICGSKGPVIKYLLQGGGGYRPGPPKN